MSAIERFSYDEYAVQLKCPHVVHTIKNPEKPQGKERIGTVRPMAKIFDPGGNAVACVDLDWPVVKSGDWIEKIRRRISAGVRVGQVRLVSDDGPVPDADWMRDTPANRDMLFKESKRIFHRSKTNTWMQFAS